MLTSLIAVAVLCGVTSFAHAQTAAPKGAKDAAKETAKPAAAAQPAAKPDPAATPAAGGPQPALVGRFPRLVRGTAIADARRVCLCVDTHRRSQTTPPT